MIQYERFILAALFTLTAASTAAVAGWTEYVYKDQRFAVSFTAPPAVNTDAPFSVEEKTAEIDFGVSAQCSIVTNKSPARIMADAVLGARLTGTVRNLTSFHMPGATAGLEMIVTGAHAFSARQRVVLKDKCLYLIFAGAKTGLSDPRVMHFLTSFRLL